MGLFDKVKNLFTEEEEPVKSEVIKVEIPAPVKEETIKEQPTQIVKEEKPAPIFFDDDYFKELDKPKKEIKTRYLKEQPKIKKEEKRVFKPTPIISPVYGVLDKNYNKEDIKPKKDKPKHFSNTTVSIDEVRQKAYGTLEDELEFTLSKISIPEKKEQEDLFEDLLDKDEVINIEDEFNDDIVEDISDKVSDKVSDKKPLAESELFDLIDSMYEKGE